MEAFFKFVYYRKTFLFGHKKNNYRELFKKLSSIKRYQINTLIY